MMGKKVGDEMYGLAEKLFSICRSITGEGVRETLEILKNELPLLQICSIESGKRVFDWTVPPEWNIKGGYIENSKGEKIIDFAENNLHVMGYSEPVDKWVTLDELKKCIYTQQNQPDVIPYVTSYYTRRYGFCMPETKKSQLKAGNYHIYIDSEFDSNGRLNYGEIILKGKTDKEILLSTYICHPSMANNELSGPCVVTHLVKWLTALNERKYTYRIIFIPETIGSIAYLSKNYITMKKNMIAGFNVSCVGDNREYSYVSSKYGDTLADKVAINILKSMAPDYKTYSFLDRGSDERQYNAAGIDLPVCAICRSKYGTYPEYHTSADDMSFISPEGLEGAYEVYKACITALEYNERYRITCLCEPQLGKRGLYPTISKKGSYDAIKAMIDFIAYADGKGDLIDISNLINVPISILIPIIKELRASELLDII